MIGSIIVVLGIILIILGYLFTMSGSRKLSGKSSGCAEQQKEYPQYYSDNYISGHDNGFHNEGAGEYRTDHVSNSTVKGGGVIMIGPIPIIFGSDRKSSEIAIILAIILMLLWFLLFR